MEQPQGVQMHHNLSRLSLEGLQAGEQTVSPYILTVGVWPPNCSSEQLFAMRSYVILPSNSMECEARLSTLVESDCEVVDLEIPLMK